MNCNFLKTNLLIVYENEVSKQQLKILFSA
nr:MAG TPA: hypothetical protein [Caudoviricetes sp.]